jgi:predicted membrane protein
MKSSVPHRRISKMHVAKVYEVMTKGRLPAIRVVLAYVISLSEMAL